jgi:hypothetical protein
MPQPLSGWGIFFGERSQVCHLCIFYYLKYLLMLHFYFILKNLSANNFCHMAFLRIDNQDGDQ